MDTGVASAEIVEIDAVEQVVDALPLPAVDGSDLGVFVGGGPDRSADHGNIRAPIVGEGSVDDYITQCNVVRVHLDAVIISLQVADFQVCGAVDRQRCQGDRRSAGRLGDDVGGERLTVDGLVAIRAGGDLD